MISEWYRHYIRSHRSEMIRYIIIGENDVFKNETNENSNRYYLHQISAKCIMYNY